MVQMYAKQCGVLWWWTSWIWKCCTFCRGISQ